DRAAVRPCAHEGLAAGRRQGPAAGRWPQRLRRLVTPDIIAVAMHHRPLRSLPALPSGRWSTGRVLGILALIVLAPILAACNNNPWPDSAAATNTLFSANIESSPRHLDPTASYWSNDTPFTYQIYEPPYGYHYLKRPFVLVPKTAEEVVKPKYVDKN